MVVKLFSRVLLPLVLTLHLTAAVAESDAALDRRAAALENQLRCLVCQNQTIADSHAGLAEDLRREVREQLAQRKSDTEVLAFMVQRYGDFVLYRPPLKHSTWLLWFGPLLLLTAGAALLFMQLRKARARVDATASGPALLRARTLLNGNSAPESKEQA